MSRIIRINSCADCPHSDMAIRSKSVEEKRVNNHFVIVTRQSKVLFYYCQEKDNKPCQDTEDGYQNIPEWCPLDKE